MKNKNKYLLFFLSLLITCATFSQQTNQARTGLLKIIDNSLERAVDQYKYLKANLPPGVLPKTYYPTKKLETSNTGWWTSGFYPGSLLYLYENSKDTGMLNEALRIQKLLEKEQFNKGTHDLGFMMFCSFGNANRLFPSKEYHDPMNGCSQRLD